jgi:uncharacterized protein (TIGR02266 family)
VSPTPAGSAVLEPEVAAGRGRILVVDGSGFFRKLLQETLQVAGHKAFAVATADEAMACLRRDLPDLVLADLGLHDGGGLELVERVRGQWDRAVLPVLVMSETQAPPEHLQRLRELGCDGCVSKYAPPDHLLFRVSSALFPADRETRRGLRVPLSVPVRVTHGSTAAFAYSSNVSHDGMFVRTSHPPPVGACVEVAFALSHASRCLRLRAEVVHAQEATEGLHAPPGFGARFIDPRPEDLALLDELVNAEAGPGG